MVEARRVHANDKIIRNSILQIVFGLQNFVKTDESYFYGLRIYVLVVFQVVEIKWSLYDQITSILWIELKWISAPRGDRESCFNGKFLVPVSHLAPLGMT